MRVFAFGTLGLVCAWTAGCETPPPPTAPVPVPALESSAADPRPRTEQAPLEQAPKPTPATAPDLTAAPLSFAPLDMTRPVAKTADGLSVMTIKAPKASASHPALRWLSPARSAMHWPEIEASDGARVYAAIDSKNGVRRDILIRDGVVHVDVMPRLSPSGVGPKGGCVAARAGQVAVALPGLSRDDRLAHQMPGEAVFIGREGQLKRYPLDRLDRRVCSKSWMDDDGSFIINEDFRTRTRDGEVRPSLGRAPMHTVGMQSTGGPLVCVASYCSKDLKNAPSTAMMKALDARPRCSKRKVRIHGRWAAGVCITDDTVHISRLDLDTHKQASGAALSRAIERTSVPGKAPTPLIAITDDGDVIVGLDYRFGKYAVWRTNASRPSPVRELASDEVLSSSNPPLLIRGLGAPAPESDTGATLMGRRLAYGAGGSTSMWPSYNTSAEAVASALERASKVLPAEPVLRYAGDAAVDLNCGSYVRSRRGNEGVRISHGGDVTIPPPTAAEVYHPPDCLPLKQVTAIPGARDVLLAITAKGELAIARLPPPLPLPAAPARRAPRLRDQPSKAAVPAAKPRPGSAWTVLSGVQVTALQGFGGELANGARKNPGQATWQYSGAALVTVANPARKDDLLVVGHQGSAWLPRAAKPMAALQYNAGFFGAEADVLVVSGEDGRARRFPLSVGSAIDAVVPRTKTSLVIGFADGREAVFDVPATGGNPLYHDAIPARIDAAVVAVTKAVYAK